jgi:hypothetical protein
MVSGSVGHIFDPSADAAAVAFAEGMGVQHRRPVVGGTIRPDAGIGLSSKVGVRLQLVDNGAAVHRDPPVVQQLIAGLVRLAEIYVAQLSGPLVHVAEESTVDVLQMGKVEGAETIHRCAQRGFGVDRGDPLEQGGRHRIGEAGQCAQGARARHQVGTSGLTLLRVRHDRPP